MTLDYTVNPLWLNDENGGWGKDDPPEIIYSDELDEIGANTELIFDESIPAEFEEEVEADDGFDNLLSSADECLPVQMPNPRSILLSQSEVKFRQTLVVNRSLLKTNIHRRPPVVTPPTPTTSSSSYYSSQQQTQPKQNQSKFRETVKVKPTNFVLNEHTMKIFKNKIKAIQKRKAQALAREKKQRPKKEKRPKVVVPVSVLKKQPVMKPRPPVNYIPQKTKPIVDPKNSGEIVRVEKAESDIDVDILSNSEEEMTMQAEEICMNVDSMSVDNPDGSWTVEASDSFEEIEDADSARKIQELKDNDSDTFDLFESLDIPQSELDLFPSVISNIERFMFIEFFEHRPTKTPERYLKIRNHIIAMWEQCKPSYLSKTSARNGLKKCGDVNCISRVHSFLEQIGGINFNCPEVSWIRPLRQLYELFRQNIRNKAQNSRKPTTEGKKEKRMRHSTSIFGAQDSNFTISHDGSSMVGNDSDDSMVHRIKSRTMHRTQFELIKCQQFSKDNEAPFQVSISISCLLCLYFHALSSKLEIMGFLGGKCVNNNKLQLIRYKPCRTSNQTAINCEMCPVSQVEQFQQITDEGFELLGWFHSHPNFPPIPSRTDLKTQTELQLQFASNNPFIGFILSCVDMEFK